MAKSKKQTKTPNAGERKYAGPISLCPLRAEDALRAFMQVRPEKVREAEEKGGR